MKCIVAGGIDVSSMRRNTAAYAGAYPSSFALMGDKAFDRQVNWNGWDEKAAWINDGRVGTHSVRQMMVGTVSQADGGSFRWLRVSFTSKKWSVWIKQSLKIYKNALVQGGAQEEN